MTDRHKEKVMEDYQTAEEIIADCATSNWLKESLSKALNRDPVDAANDADFLAVILNARAEAALSAQPD
jgi:hypothetical protein